MSWPLVDSYCCWYAVCFDPRKILNHEKKGLKITRASSRRTRRRSNLIRTTIIAIPVFLSLNYYKPSVIPGVMLENKSLNFKGVNEIFPSTFFDLSLTICNFEVRKQFIIRGDRNIAQFCFLYLLFFNRITL